MDGEPAGLITSEKRQHVDSFKRPTFEPSTEVGIRSGLREDLYLVFAGAVDGTEEAVYRFNINPLVWWVWFGGLRAGVRRDRDDVAGRRADHAPPRRAQGGYGVSLVGRGEGVTAMTRAAARRAGFLAAASALARGAALAAGRGARCRRAAQDSLAGRGAVGTLRDPSAVGRPRAPTDPEENDGGDPGDREAAGLQLRLHARRVHLPHHRLLLHLLAQAASRGPGAPEPGASPRSRSSTRSWPSTARRR